ncbi:hypothetical protein P22_3336 [Propionispora sp. 2/2-37]|uniref:hypothetical protein n=1 Tax=Propionispora sp. 2/2-37 TaxID=1677858 RepID=UPI0006BB5BFB|nr:hypothetical protein [Propionispora sp. 2/2-37]CUH97209.1 hypothetical protein P22_3336 [Propionispora sp. 2/2-37]
MKVLKEAIPVAAYFGPDGNIKPLAFKYNCKEYKVANIKWWQFGKPIWTERASRIYCVSTQDDKIAELVWEVDTGVWRLIKFG